MLDIDLATGPRNTIRITHMPTIFIFMFLKILFRLLFFSPIYLFHFNHYTYISGTIRYFYKYLRIPVCFVVYGQKTAKKEEERKDEEFKCPEGQGNGNFADPATCRRFYQVNTLKFNNITIHMSFDCKVRYKEISCLCVISIVRRRLSVSKQMSVGATFRRY